LIGGGSPRAWHQWVTGDFNKEVLEIYPTGHFRDFEGYFEEIISYAELVDIVNHQAGNQDWFQRLSAVAGVYLITDNITGQQYVGAAYGKNGIWGRWEEYAHCPHGGDEKLKELLTDNPGREKSFQFTILQILPEALKRDEALIWEKLYKDKLGSRVYGLNLN
jgi:hypothetical protein